MKFDKQIILRPYAIILNASFVMKCDCDEKPWLRWDPGWIHREGIFKRSVVEWYDAPLCPCCHMRTNHNRWSLTLISCATNEAHPSIVHNKNEVLLFITNPAWCIVKFLSLHGRMSSATNWLNLPFSTQYLVSRTRCFLLNATAIFSSRNVRGAVVKIFCNSPPNRLGCQTTIGAKISETVPWIPEDFPVAFQTRDFARKLIRAIENGDGFVINFNISTIYYDSPTRFSLLLSVMWNAAHSARHFIGIETIYA